MELPCSWHIKYTVVLLYSLIVDLSVGELECIDDVDIDGCVECVAANPTLIVGTKLRLSAQIAKAGKNELEGLR